MEKIFKDFLFNKNILVGEKKSENPFEVCFALARLFDIKITEGMDLAEEAMIRQAEQSIGRRVPAAFYRGFPKSVRRLTVDELRYDQFIHYASTYGMGNFDDPGRSILEEELDCEIFKENTEVKKFVILSEEEAEVRLREYVDGTFRSSRPLNEGQFEVVADYVFTYSYQPDVCVCKDTAIRLACYFRDASFARYLSLSDVLKLVDRINYEDYNNRNIRKLNLKNVDRKFITAVLDTVFESGRCNVIECFEKKAIWSGVLHHIHYKAKCDAAVSFLDQMRGDGNKSVYADFERYMSEANVKEAVRVLREGKGAGAVLRNLNYLISRCDTVEDIKAVLECVDSTNAILLIQLIMQYASYTAGKAREFKFVRYNLMRKHTETPAEAKRRRTVLSNNETDMLAGIIREKLAATLKGRLGKVYIGSEMNRMAIPLQESAGSSGYGTLAKGSRIPLESGKIVRAFTYWEKVNDIDLSVIGICENGSFHEFSWRSTYAFQSKAITFSGDQTSGYNGGSEYFDIDTDAFRKKFDDVRYLVFCNNVFSCTTFDKCVCRAGYMLRDRLGSGEIFEPKTVKSSFTVKGDTTFSYLFGIDLEKNEFVWLNVDRDSSAHVAGATSMDFLTVYFKYADILSVADLFSMMATEVVDDPALADVVVSDEDITVSEGVRLIRSCDLEKITALLS